MEAALYWTDNVIYQEIRKNGIWGDEWRAAASGNNLTPVSRRNWLQPRA
jgi:hypothetical protein